MQPGPLSLLGAGGAGRCCSHFPEKQAGGLRAEFLEVKMGPDPGLWGFILGVFLLSQSRHIPPTPQPPPSLPPLLSLLLLLFLIGTRALTRRSTPLTEH